MKKLTALLIAISLILALAACGKKNEDTTTTDPAVNETTLPAVTDAPSTLPAESTSAQDVTTTEAITSAPETTVPAITEAPSTEAPATQAPVTEAPVTQAPVTEAPVTEAPTAAPVDNSTAAALQILSDAINKTKAYTAPITVNHTEAFNIVEPVVKLNSAEALSGLATKAVNFVKDLVLKPSSEVYNFNGGTATTSEGEATQLLLPKDKAFGLPADAVASAEITDENGGKRIKLTLKPEETHSLSEVPVNHANSIGYLDIDGAFSIIQIDAIDITYPGSTIDALVRADGYVQSVTYVINLAASSTAHGMGISGSATFSGSQTESWEINW